MRKNTLRLMVLAFAASFMFVGCGGGSDDLVILPAQPTATPTATPTTTPTPTPPTPTPAPTDTPVDVETLLPSFK